MVSGACNWQLWQGLFPNRHDLLHLIDEPLTGGEGFTSVRCDDLHPKRSLTRPDHADAMDEADGSDGPASLQFVEQSVELMLGHGAEAFVFQGGDGLGGLAAAHDATEIDGCALIRSGRAGSDELRFVNRGRGDGEGAVQAVSNQCSVVCGKLAALDGRKQADFVTGFQHVSTALILDANGDEG